MDFDLPAYLQRIGLESPVQPDLATLTAVMAHHSRSIAFENLDVVLRKVVDCGLPAVQA